MFSDQGKTLTKYDEQFSLLQIILSTINVYITKNMTKEFVIHYTFRKFKVEALFT